MFREPLAGAVPLSLEPLQTTDAHAYWQTFVSGRTDLPTSDLKVHLDRYLALPPEEQRSHFSVKRDGRIIGTVRLGPAEISGFSMDPTSREEAAAALLKSMDLLRAVARPQSRRTSRTSTNPHSLRSASSVSLSACGWKLRLIGLSCPPAWCCNLRRRTKSLASRSSSWMCTKDTWSSSMASTRGLRRNGAATC